MYGSELMLDSKIIFPRCVQLIRLEIEKEKESSYVGVSGTNICAGG